jgi:hypothetical protein
MLEQPRPEALAGGRTHRQTIQFDPFKLIFDSWGRVAARKLLILLVWGTDFSKV